MTDKELQAFKTKFGENARAIREAKGLSQRDVSLSCKLERGKISEIENGKHDIRLKTIMELCKGLDVHPSQLFNF